MKSLIIKEKGVTMLSPFHDGPIEEANLDKIACHGCSHCCYNMPIGVNYMEEKTFRATFENVKANRYNHPLLKPKGLKFKAPCSMLDTVHEKCMIYENRPSVCSAYYSISEESCKRFLKESIDGNGETVTSDMFSVMKHGPIEVANVMLDLDAFVEMAIIVLKKYPNTTFEEFYNLMGQKAANEMQHNVEIGEMDFGKI